MRFQKMDMLILPNLKNGEEMLKVSVFDLKENICVRINENFMRDILSKILSFNMPFYKIARKLNIDESLLREIKKNPTKKIEIKTLKKMLNFLKNRKIEINKKNIESNIIWIGNICGKGLTYPKLPFILNSPQFVTLLSAAFGDGTITNIAYSAPKKYKLGVFEYTNEEAILRENLIKSSMEIFGGTSEDYVQRPNRNTVSLFFPSIIRDVLLLAGGARGKKSILNPGVPDIVMNSNDRDMWISWLCQSFDDEGCVRYRRNYNNEIFLTRTCDVTKNYPKTLKPSLKIPFRKLSTKEQKVILKNPNNLLIDELKLLKRLGIRGKIRPEGIYVTKCGEIKVKWRLYITRKENIRKFAQIIGFKIPRKQMILKKIIDDNNEIPTEN
jgi:hypothetical protein